LSEGGSHLPEPLVSTFSIVALDLRNGDLGVAVQSKYFSVGPVVPWAEAGVGAIATQAWANVSYGPEGLELLRRGLSAEEVVEELTGKDPERDRRQLGVVDARGRVAVYTGERCIPWAGSRTGRGYTVQGNILTGPEVVEAMAEAFERARGELAKRLVEALWAGQEAGGDARGRQSAALLVVREGAGPGGYRDRYIELRVEDHVTPIRELKRLLDMKYAYILMGRSRRKAEEGCLEEALSLAEEAVARSPGLDSVYLNLGGIYYRLGDRTSALEAYREAIRINPMARGYLKRVIAQSLGLEEEFLRRL